MERRAEQESDMSGVCRIFGHQKSRNRDKMRILAKIRAKKSRPTRGGRSACRKKRIINYFSSLTSGVGADGKFLNAGSGRSAGASESLVQQKQQELDNKAVAAKASSVNVRVMVVVVFWLLKKWERITG
jgi:hypothetical protein